MVLMCVSVCLSVYACPPAPPPQKPGSLGTFWKVSVLLNHTHTRGPCFPFTGFFIIGSSSLRGPKHLENPQAFVVKCESPPNCYH